LKDEKRRIASMEAKLNIDGEELKTVQKLLSDKDELIFKAEAQRDSL